MTLESSSSNTNNRYETTTRRRGRTFSPTAKAEFSSVVSHAIGRLEREHGYSRERATCAVLQEMIVVTAASSSSDDEQPGATEQQEIRRTRQEDEEEVSTTSIYEPQRRRFRITGLAPSHVNVTELTHLFAFILILTFFCFVVPHAY
jgi:hypothetical protein